MLSLFYFSWRSKHCYWTIKIHECNKMTASSLEHVVTFRMQVWKAYACYTRTPIVDGCTSCNSVMLLLKGRLFVRDFLRFLVSFSCLPICLSVLFCSVLLSALSVRVLCLSVSLSAVSLSVCLSTRLSSVNIDEFALQSWHTAQVTVGGSYGLQ